MGHSIRYRCCGQNCPCLARIVTDMALREFPDRFKLSSSGYVRRDGRFEAAVTRMFPLCPKQTEWKKAYRANRFEVREGFK